MMPAAYSQAYHTNQYDGMSPERIVLAMYDGALGAMDRAIEAIAQGQVAARGEAISKAVAILAELLDALNMDAGMLSERLAALYDYAIRELVSANLHGDAEQILRNRGLIREVRDAWAEMTKGLSETKKTEAPKELRRIVL